MKILYLVLLSYSLVLLAPGANSFACEQGCTPGYWKNHTESWPAQYTPETTIAAAFDCGNFPNGTTLLEALNSKGGGLFALQRHAVAALLNASTIDCFDFTGEQVKIAFCKALGSNMEAYKDCFEKENDGECPLN